MDTFLRDAFGFISWYVLVSVIGLVSFPLVFKYLPALRDRGYTLMRVVGLLVWGFLFWMLSSLGILENTLSGQVLALIVLIAAGGLIIRKNGLHEITSWLKENTRLIVTAELLFLVAFILMAFIRSANPDISGTEKPMELAFINAILRSPGMPPNDPWLSGYAISYYYFGYVMVAMLIRMSGVISGVGFNLAIALWYALSATGAYGIVYNLLALSDRRSKGNDLRGIYSLPLFGPLFLLIVSNLEGFLEIIHNAGWFWKKLADGSYTSKFWTWLDILDLSSPPAFNGTLRYLSWWRASRVLQDYDLVGAPREIIDEFPQFSFLLADLHPHVLAMPFLLLGVAIALNFYHARSSKGLSLWGIHLPLTWDQMLFAGLCLGGLGFLNLWDFPFAVLLFTGAYLMKRYAGEEFSLRLVADAFLLFLLVMLTGLVLYLPFYLSFASQAGGLIPSLVFFTRGAHFWVMFGSLLAPVVTFLVWKLKKAKAYRRLGEALLVSILLFAGAFFLMLVFGSVVWNLPAIQEFLAPAILWLKPDWAGWGNPRAYLESVFAAQGQSFLVVFMVTLQERLQAPGAWLTLIGLSTCVLALLKRPPSAAPSAVDAAIIPAPVKRHKPDFALLVMAVGLLLLIIPEFFYLRDLFGWRMNTIFKFYYHAWILLSLCAAYGFIRVFSETTGRKWVVAKIGLFLVLIAALVYSPVMLNIKTNSFCLNQPCTLDGNQYFNTVYTEDAEAIEWLSLHEVGVVAEAIGGSYSGYARVSTLTGFPTVLGWPGHEDQWRGGGTEMGSRYGDIGSLYETDDWYAAEAIIRQYDIRYIYIGNLERSTYPVSDTKFLQNLSLIYDAGSVVIFEVDGSMDE